MAFPPVGWQWLVLPGLVGLLVSLNGQHGSRARALGLLHGYTAFAVSLSWLWNIFGGMSVALWAVLAIFPTAFAHFQGRAFLRGWVGWKFALFTAINWGAWEFIRAEIFPLKLPWMTAGLALGPNLLLPWIGVYGVGAIVVFAAALLSARIWKIAGPVMAILLVAVFLSRPVPALKPGGEGVVSMGGVQLENVTIDSYIKATEAMPADVEYVVWPEYAVAYDIMGNNRDWNLLRDLCEKRNITLTFGTRTVAGTDGKWSNIALTMHGSGYLGAHAKVHTVHFFDDGVPGTTALPIKTPYGKVGTPICFDADYEGIVRGMVSTGAEIIVIPTMDAESWGATQHDQHAELARIRAAENARWIFVSATSGVSQVIDPHGHLHARLGALEQGNLFGLVKRETGLTPYTRFGWMLPWLSLGLALIAWIFLLFPMRKQPPLTPPATR